MRNEIFVVFFMVSVDMIVEQGSGTWKHGHK